MPSDGAGQRQKNWPRFFFCVFLLLAAINVEAKSFDINLKAQSLGASLNELSVLTGIQIFYEQNLLESLETVELSGTFELAEIFHLLLQDTNLELKSVSAKTYVLALVPVTKSEKVISAPSSTPVPVEEAEMPDVIPEVRVTASPYQNQGSADRSVTSITDYDVDAFLYRDISEVSVLAPNVIIDSGNANTSSMSVRGISLSDLEKSFDPAVGVVVDGVYFGSTTATLLSTFDTELVEVLRGPQGTAEGRNTTAGVIKLAHSKPTGEFGGRFGFSYGSNQLQDEKLLFNFPIVSEKLAGKLSYYHQSGGAYIRNITTGRKEGAKDNQNMGASLLWTPDSQLTVQYSYFLDKDWSDSVPFLNSSPDDSLQCVQFSECGKTYKGKRVTASPEKHPAKFDVDMHVLRLNYQFDNHSFEAISGYRNIEEQIVIDYDSSPSRLLFTDRPAVDQALSSELKISSEYSKGINYIAGTFYWNREYSLNQTSYHVLELPFYNNGGTERFDMKQNTWSLSWFGELNIPVLESLDLTLGARNTRERKRASGAVFYIDNNGQVLEDNDDALQQAGFTSAVYGGSKDWTDTTLKASLKYQVNKDFAWYIQYAEGFRSGGFNGRARSQIAIEAYDPERVKNYEIGYRSRWLDGRLIFNPTVFYTEYNNKQESFTTYVDGVSTALVKNAAAAIMRGIEIEAQYWRGNFKLAMGYGYLYSDYKHFDVHTGDGAVVDNSDAPLLLSPRNTFGLTLGYNTHLQKFSDVQLGYVMEFNYRGPYQTSSDDPKHAYVDSYTRVNAALSYTWQQWKISLYGKNLTNEYYLPYTNNVTEGVLGDSLFSLSSVNRPRSWGLEITKIF